MGGLGPLSKILAVKCMAKIIAFIFIVHLLDIGKVVRVAVSKEKPQCPETSSCVSGLLF